MLISEIDALIILEDAIERCGGPSALARAAGVTSTVISAMRGKAKRRQPITGKVADFLGLRRTYAYERKQNAADPKQEQYEKARREWARINDIPLEQSKTMRVAGEQLPGRRYPDKA